MIDLDRFLSPHFRLREFVRSERAESLGIDNRPSQEHVLNLIWHCHAVLEPIRFLADRPVIITSGYRSPALNSQTPGSSNSSQHRAANLDAATDIKIPGLKLRRLAEIASSPEVDFDQLILEDSCLHISSVANNRRGRRERLIRTWNQVAGRFTYSAYV